MQISKAQYNRLPERLQKHFNHGNFHCTLKPIALMEYLVKLVTREGQTVLDPFMGSGTTGIACKNLNRKFIGIEKEQDYMAISRARINNNSAQIIKEPIEKDKLNKNHNFIF